jgi:hypothetical protein
MQPIVSEVNNRRHMPKTGSFGWAAALTLVGTQEPDIVRQLDALVPAESAFWMHCHIPMREVEVSVIAKHCGAKRLPLYRVWRIVRELALDDRDVESIARYWFEINRDLSWEPSPFEHSVGWACSRVGGNTIPGTIRAFHDYVQPTAPFGWFDRYRALNAVLAPGHSDSWLGVAKYFDLNPSLLSQLGHLAYRAAT